MPCSKQGSFKLELSSANAQKGGIQQVTKITTPGDIPMILFLGWVARASILLMLKLRLAAIMLQNYWQWEIQALLAEARLPIFTTD